jgi:hypothetical protein
VNQRQLGGDEVSLTTGKNIRSGKKITPESREHPGPRASNIHCARTRVTKPSVAVDGLSVRTSRQVDLAGNDLFLAKAAMPAFCCCGYVAGVTESVVNHSSTLLAIKGTTAMMHADLIDQDDLAGHLRARGFDIPAGASAEQACEAVVRGLNEPNARALKGMVEQMYTGSATILPAVRQAIDKQLLPALAQFNKRA